MLEELKTQAYNILSKCDSDKQIDMAIEEMSELTKALLKDRRYQRISTQRDVIEELADVYNMLEQVRIIYAFNDVDIVRIRSNKNIRTLERLKHSD